MAEEYLVHCSFCGYNFDSASHKSDQQCPSCDHRASHAEPIEESNHTLGIKTNYKGKPFDETENKVP
jgi:tRNA(Ile2) C34 agmatinyltransferase TiaS